MLTPERIDAAHERELSRLVCIYGLRRPTDVGREAELTRAHKLWQLERFEGHFTELGEEMPSFTESVRWPATTVVASSRGEFASVERAAARVASVPASGTVLVFSLDFAADLRQAIVVLQETCFRRSSLTLDGVPLLDSLAGVIGADASPIELDREVHQCLFPGRSLTVLLRSDEPAGTGFDELALLRLVYREDESFRPSGASMRYPVELNRPVQGVAVHGRGVSVVVGAAEHVERGVALTAVELVACLGCVRRVRRQANMTLQAISDISQPAQAATPSNRLEEFAALAESTRTLEVDLSYGVDRYLDNLRIPEIVLTSYRQSLAESLELPRTLDTTSRMIERLRRLIEVRHVELASTRAKEAERRRHANAAAVGYVTLVAVPFGFILAFLGSNVRNVGERESIWDVGFFWMYYVAAFAIMLPALAFWAITLYRNR